MEPWGPTESKMMQLLVQQREDIIENRSTETDMMRKKNAVWNSIRNDMRAAGYYRTIEEMKHYWGKMKMAAAKISKIRLPPSWIRGVNTRMPVQIVVSSDMEELYMFHANDADAILPYLAPRPPPPNEGPSSSSSANGAGNQPAVAAAVQQNVVNQPNPANPPTGTGAGNPPAANPPAGPTQSAPPNQRPPVNAVPFVAYETVPMPTSAAITNTVDSPIASGVVSTSVDSPELPLNITYVPNVSEADVFATSKAKIEQEIEQTAELHWLEVNQRKELHALRCQQLKEEIEQQRELFKMQLKKIAG